MVRLATFVSSQIIHIILVHCQKKIRILAKKPACYGWSRCNGTYVFGSWARFTFTQKLDVYTVAIGSFGANIQIILTQCIAKNSTVIELYLPPPLAVPRQFALINERHFSLCQFNPAYIF